MRTRLSAAALAAARRPSLREADGDPRPRSRTAAGQPPAAGRRGAEPGSGPADARRCRRPGRRVRRRPAAVAGVVWRQFKEGYTYSEQGGGVVVKITTTTASGSGDDVLVFHSGEPNAVYLLSSGQLVRFDKNPHMNQGC